MHLDESQNDALRELINIGFGRAAAALSALTGQRVEIQAPSLMVCPVSDLTATLGAVLKDDVATVHQVFSGPVAGDAMLILDRGGAGSLTRLLTHVPADSLHFDENARDVLTEIGNILLNACLDTVGNLLNVYVTFSVPRLTVATLGAMVHSLVIMREELRFALVVQASFHVRDSDVEGYLLIALTVDSLDRLLDAIRQSQERQG